MPKQEFRLEAMKIYDKMRHSWDIVGCLTDSLEELVEKTQFKEHELYIDEDAKPSLPMSADVEKAKEAYVEVPVRIMERWISALSMCDGNSHATTERTCETFDDDRYEYKGAIHQRVAGIWFRIENNIIVDRDQYRHDLEARVKPIPAAKDAEECKKSFKDKVHRIDKDGHADHLNTSYVLWDDVLASWNRRPSRPMSAEVEKAVETVRERIEDLHKCEGGAEGTCYRLALESVDSLISALKVRGPLVSEPDFEEHDLYVYDDARPL